MIKYVGGYLTICVSDIWRSWNIVAKKCKLALYLPNFIIIIAIVIVNVIVYRYWIIVLRDLARVSLLYIDLYIVLVRYLYWFWLHLLTGLPAPDPRRAGVSWVCQVLFKNFQLGLERVLSFWSSFITSSHINNYQFNSFARADLPDASQDQGGLLVTGNP